MFWKGFFLILDNWNIVNETYLAEASIASHCISFLKKNETLKLSSILFWQYVNLLNVLFKKNMDITVFLNPRNNTGISD